MYVTCIIDAKIGHVVYDTCNLSPLKIENYLNLVSRWYSS